MTDRPRRTLPATALAILTPFAVGACFAAASFASGPQAVEPGAELPTEVVAPTEEPAPQQLIAAGPGVFTAEQLAGSRTVPQDVVEDRLLEWVSLPGSGETAHCGGTLSTQREGRFSTCTVTATDGSTRTFYGYVAEDLAYAQGYQLFYAEGAPLSAEATAALTDVDAAVLVHPVYDETAISQPTSITSEQAASAGNRILELAGERDVRIVSVDAALDLSVPEPVTAIAQDRATGMVRMVELLPVVMDGESPVLVVVLADA